MWYRGIVFSVYNAGLGVCHVGSLSYAVALFCFSQRCYFRLTASVRLVPTQYCLTQRSPRIATLSLRTFASIARHEMSKRKFSSALHFAPFVYSLHMYHLIRNWHKWIGIVISLILCSIAVTGFLLATKGTFGWIRPPEAKASEKRSDLLANAVSLEVVLGSVLALNLAEIKDVGDIDRIDYRPKSHIYKVVSKEGYKEVQVDAATGKVLQVAIRNDQLAEDIHDLSFFSDAIKDFGLPVVAVGLLLMASSGIAIFFVPVIRRARFRRSGKMPEKSP